VEAIVPNGDSRLLPGQFLTLDISTGRSQSALRVPVGAIHTKTPAAPGVNAGAAISYVWVADAIQDREGYFSVREAEIETGVSDGVNVEVTSGLQQGQRVVVTGADNLKNSDTVMMVQPEASGSTPAASSMQNMPGMSHQGMNMVPAVSPNGSSAPNEATVEVSIRGFTPPSVNLKANVPAMLTFIRKDDKTCGTEIVLPEYGIKRSLPLNKPVTIEFTPRKGSIVFTCGMNMLSGKAVAQ